MWIGCICILDNLKYSDVVYNQGFLNQYLQNVYRLCMLLSPARAYLYTTTTTTMASLRNLNITSM